MHNEKYHGFPILRRNIVDREETGCKYFGILALGDILGREIKELITETYTRHTGKRLSPR